MKKPPINFGSFENEVRSTAMLDPTLEEVRSFVLRALVTMTGRPKWYWEELVGEVAPVLFPRDHTNWDIFPEPAGANREMIELSVSAVKLDCPRVLVL